jgi:hypothetical protein
MAINPGAPGIAMPPGLLGVTMKCCTHCGQENPEAARFCLRCGTAFGAGVAVGIIQSATHASPLMERWRKLTTHTTRREVKRLLGEPARIELSLPQGGSVISGALSVETWTYEYEVAGQPERRVAGSILISVFEARVMSWVEPEWKALSEE